MMVSQRILTNSKFDKARLKSSRRCRLFALVSCALLLFVGICPSYGDGEGGVNSTENLKFSIDIVEGAFIPVEVLGAKCNFVIDTGSTISVLDVEFLNRLGAPVKERKLAAVTKAQSLKLFAAPEMKVGVNPQIPFRSVKPIGCLDLSAVRAILGTDNPGILGMDFLQSRIVHFHFDNGFGEFSDHSTSDSTHIEQLHMPLGCPHLLMRLPSEGFKQFAIDTGDYGESLRLERDLFKRLVERRRLVLIGTTQTAEINHTSTHQHGILDCVEFGPHRFFNVSVSEGLHNSLSLKFLRRFDVEFDFPNRTARFRAGKRIDDRDRRNRADLGLHRIDGKTDAIIMDESGIAWRAGIRDGDRILQCDGIDTDKGRIAVIRDRLHQPGAEVKIVYEHEGTVKDVVLTLSNEPDPFPAKSPHELIEIPDDFDK